MITSVVPVARPTVPGEPDVARRPTARNWLVVVSKDECARKLYVLLGPVEAAIIYLPSRRQEPRRGILFYSLSLILLRCIPSLSGQEFHPQTSCPSPAFF